jgi:hypothetical protein
MTTVSCGPLSHFYDLNLKTIQKIKINCTQQTNVIKYFYILEELFQIVKYIFKSRLNGTLHP